MTDARRTGASGPLFVVGCGRSGTTLLRLMLTAHPDLAIPEETHVLYEWMRLRARGRGAGPLADEASRRTLLDFVCGHPRTRHLGLDEAALRARVASAPATHAGVFGALFEQVAAEAGKPRWGDKTPQHVQYLLVLAALFPQARFVHLVRDGRDTALSMLALRARGLSRWGPRSMGHAGHYWAWLVLSGLAAGRVLGPARYRQLRFEDLVADPEPHLRDLCDWAGLGFHPDVLGYHANETTRAYASVGDPRKRWLTRPPDPQRTGRWRHDMSPGDQASLARQAGGLLAHLGYETPALSVRQRHLADALASLERDGLDELDAAAAPRRLRGLPLVGALAVDRARQYGALRGGRLRAFTLASFRWQRTVAALLAEAETGNTPHAPPEGPA